MSRDCAKKPRTSNRRSPTKSSPTPSWVWLLVGFLLGAFAASLYFIKHPTGAAVVKEEPKPKVRDNKTPKPRFDFYKLLQESETIVPASETPSTTVVEAEKNQDNIEYILQVGSFPSSVDADKLRAQLILLNLKAHIEKVEIRKGELWHRVVVGPFDTQAALASGRSQLVSNQYNALVLKRAKTKP